MRRSSTGSPSTAAAQSRCGADTTLGGRLRLGPVQVLAPAEPVASALRFRTLTEVPEAPAPWTVSRVATDRDTLRVEIANPGAQGDPAQHRFVVGVPGADPVLTVQATGAVTLHANALTVEGLVVQGPAKPHPADPRVARAMIDKWLTWTLTGRPASCWAPTWA